MNLKSENQSMNSSQQNSSLDQLMQAHEQAITCDTQKKPGEVRIRVTKPEEGPQPTQENSTNDQAAQDPEQTMTHDTQMEPGEVHIRVTMPEEEPRSTSHGTAYQPVWTQPHQIGIRKNWYQRLEENIEDGTDRTVWEVQDQKEQLQRYIDTSLMEQMELLLQAGSRSEQNILDDTREMLRFFSKVNRICSWVKQRLPIIAIIMGITFLGLRLLEFMLWLKLLT